MTTESEEFDIQTKGLTKSLTKSLISPDSANDPIVIDAGKVSAVRVLNELFNESCIQTIKHDGKSYKIIGVLADTRLLCVEEEE